MVLGLVATVVAVVLVSALLGSPEHVAMAMDDADLTAVFRLVLDRLAAAAAAVLRLL